jgi:hypothetical protein
MTNRAPSYPRATREYASAIADSASAPVLPASFPTGCTRHPSFALSVAPSPRFSRELSAGYHAPKADDAALGGREHMIASLPWALRFPSVTVTPNAPSNPPQMLPTCQSDKYGPVTRRSFRGLWQASSLTSEAHADKHAKPLESGRLTLRQPRALTTDSLAVSRPANASHATLTPWSLPMRASASPNPSTYGSLRSERGNVNKPSSPLGASSCVEP